MATFKEALTTSLTNFAKSIAKTYPKTANIVDNLLSTDSTLPLSAKQGNVLKGQIDELNSHTHNYAGSSSAGGAATTALECTGNSATATKLQTPRKINITGEHLGSVIFDGSDDVTIETYSAYSKATVCNKNNYPWHRFAKTGPITSMGDREIIFMVSRPYIGAGWGLLRVLIRTEASVDGVATAQWIIRNNLEADCVKLGFYNIKGNVYADLFYKSDGAYRGALFRVLETGTRTASILQWDLINSLEIDNTTVDDPLTSYESYVSIENASEVLHPETGYTSIITPTDNGRVAYANSSDTIKTVQLVSDADLDTLKDENMTLYYAANGNTINNNPEAKQGFLLRVHRVGGANICQELVSQTGKMYIRHFFNSAWSDFKRVAYTTDNVASATKATQDGNGNNIVNTYASKRIYGDNAISLGRRANTTVGTESVALGSDVTASGDYSHAEGKETAASGDFSHAECYKTTASGDYSHAEGCSSIASGDRSHAEGNYTTALTNQHAQGHYNDTTLAKANSESGISDGTAFVIGNGTISVKSNAFRVTGKGQAIGKTSFASSGADYAEYFEWEDGNNENEDRVGYFVTLGNGNYIKKASEGDYILGVVSGLPCVIGNNDECWKKQFLMDEWGRFIYETQTYTDEKTGETHEVTFYKVNPDYDSSKEYIHREDRKEWSAIGMFGVLSVYDDGSCQVNSYCKCTNGGIATACERGIDSYRVIERVTDNIVKIVLK